MLVAGLGAFLLTVHWVRSRNLRERYAIWWLLLATALLAAGLMPDWIKRTATAANLSYPAFVLFVALSAIYVFSFFVCVRLTDQHRRTNRALQELALLKHRLETLEANGSDGQRPNIHG
jgi:hypothetical protein